MHKIILVGLTVFAFAQSANACVGGATSVRHGQIEAVNEAIFRDYSVNWKGIESLIVGESEVTVVLSDYVGDKSVRVYKTVPSKDSGPLTGKCDKFDAILVK